MDLPAILIKITGFVLLMWNSFSVYKHIQEKRTNKGDAKGTGAISFRTGP